MKQDFFTIKGLMASAFAETGILTGDGRVKIENASGTSGLTDTELRASRIDVLQVSGSIDSTQVRLISRQTNPTAVADAAVSFGSSDDLGRTITRPVQARDLIHTAYVQISNGTETTLRAAVAGSFLDLIYVMGANNSDAAVSVDLRPVTAGNVIMTLQIPASGTAGIACPVPLPVADTGNNWTADMGDITGTTVSLTALFSQEV